MGTDKFRDFIRLVEDGTTYGVADICEENKVAQIFLHLTPEGRMYNKEEELLKKVLSECKKRKYKLATIKAYTANIPVTEAIMALDAEIIEEKLIGTSKYITYGFKL